MAAQFPLPNLPLELRDKIWEESIIQSHKSPSTSIDNRLTAAHQLGPTYISHFYSFASPTLSSLTTISSACRESHAATSRLLSQLPPDEEYSLSRSETLVVILTNFYSHEKPQAAVDFIQSSPDPVVLHISSMNLTNAHEAERVLAMVLAAKNYQVKLLCHEERQSFVFPNGVKEAPATKDWVPQKSRLVSVYDVRAWRELKGLADAAELSWEMVEGMVDAKGERRRKIVNGTVKLVEDLWERENEKRVKAGKEGLKPLPRMDVCVKVEVSQGGPMGMCFAFGAMDAGHIKAMEEMVNYGIL